MSLIVKPRHLELLKSEDIFFIKINSLLGRLSLFADHPKFKFKEAMDFKKKSHKTSGRLSLINLKKKDLYILEDTDELGNKAQNFIFVDDELSRTMNVYSSSKWLKEHLLDFFTRSISVPFFIFYMIYFYTTMRYFNTTDTLFVLRYITGVITLVFAVSYYYLRSVKTKSSFLKFCFKTELFLFIIAGTLNNVEHITMLLSNATDIF